jgi:hypothetical protein
MKLNKIFYRAFRGSSIKNARGQVLGGARKTIHISAKRFGSECNSFVDIEIW